MKENNPLLSAFDKHSPSAIYFDNKRNYKMFIEEIIKEPYEPNTFYSYKGIPIRYWDKNLGDLIGNDILFKQMR